MQRADVVVIGAGLIGSAIAWRLGQAGRKVVLLDKGEPGGESSSAAAGLLQPEGGREGGPELVRLWRESLALYPGFVAELGEVTGAIFEYRAPGRLALALDEAEEAALRERLAAQAPVGIRAELLSGDEARRLEPEIAPETRVALHFPDHALVDNQRLSLAVPLAAKLAGVEIRAYEPALRIVFNGGRAEGVETTGGRIAADVVVNAAGAWANQLVPTPTPIVGPAKGEIIALHTRPRPFERNIQLANASIGSRGDGRIIVGSTVVDAGFNKEITAKGVLEMLTLAVRALPVLREARFVEAWTGLRPKSVDEQAIVGPDHIAGLFWATGHYKLGILSTPATAEVVSRMILGQALRFPVDALSPRRFS